MTTSETKTAVERWSIRSARMLDRWVAKIENTEALDEPADKLAGALGVLEKQPARDLLSGTPAAHPAHPSLVTLPIGAWTTATVLDVVGQRRAARTAIGFGLLAALPTAATGLNDWMDTVGAERRVGLVHALVNDVALGLYTASWLARRKGRNARGVMMAGAGAAVLTVGGWLGGHLAYARGVGVDTTAFQQGPADWTDVLAEAELPAVGAMTQVEAGGVPLLLVRTASGLSVLADRCTHRGGPLSEGKLVDGPEGQCVECPWHQSVFALSDGSVVRGPATRPQPVYEARVEAGRVQVRRNDDPYSLRTNPVGH